jgi:hypothetical protein
VADGVRNVRPTLPTLVESRFLRYDVSFGKPVADPTSHAIQARRAMALGPFVFDFSTSCSVLRSCAYVHAIALRLALLLQEYFKRVRGLFLTAIAVNRRYAFAIVLSVACQLCM